MFSFNSVTPEKVHTQLLTSLFSQNVDNLTKVSQYSFLSSPPCVNFDYLEKWLKREDIKKALHISPTTSSRDWVPCSLDVSMLYERQYKTVQNEVQNLLKNGKKVLIYNGDVDSMCNFLAGQWFAEGLGQKVVEKYSPWMVNGQVAGFTKKYANNLTFTTVKGSGHTVPEDKPAEALAMFEDFILV